MAFPAGWPPRPATAQRSIRFYQPSTVATANFSDRAYLFGDQAGANTIRPLPYVAPGNTDPISVGDPTADLGVGVSGPSSLPVGTGRDARDAIFHPDVFLRGGGTSVTFTLASTTITLEDPDANFTGDLVSKEIVIRDATSGGNNGTFIITSVPSTKSVTYENAGGATEAMPAAGAYRIRRIHESVPKEMVWASNIRIVNAGGGDLEISFDGVNVQGLVPSGEIYEYNERYEAGIAVRGNGVTFVIEAW
jgi:hypothetical protein